MLLSNRIATGLDPWRVMRAIEDQWNQHWGEWFDNAPVASSEANFRLWTGDGRAVIEFDLPGLSPENVEIAVHENRLTIDVHSSEEVAASGEEFHLRERLPATGREVRLPFTVDPHKTEAEYRHGVLRVTVEQPESHRPARIAVKS